MKALLDTHTLLWAKISPTMLTRPVTDVMADQNNTIYVSAVSAWEIATKVRLGKLPGAVRMEREFLAMIDDSGYTLLPIEASAALRAGRLSGKHRDPFDRLLAAQALELDIPILSQDSELDAFGIHRIW